MDKFEYTTVLVSIVIAFAMSEILSGWGHMLRMRHRLRPWWPHTLWTLLVLLALMQSWWGTWQYRHVDLEGFDALLLLVAPILAMVIGVFILMPDLSKGEVDLRAHFMENRRWFFVFAALSVVLLAVVDAVIGRQPLLHVENAIRGVALLVLYGLLFLFVPLSFRA